MLKNKIKFWKLKVQQLKKRLLLKLKDLAKRLSMKALKKELLKRNSILI